MKGSVVSTLAAVVLALAAVLPVAAGEHDGAGAAADLDWIAGYWTQRADDGSGVVEELWLPSVAGVMVGIHRDTRRPAGERNKTRVFFEYLRIETRN